ncbi:hypothetical protein [Agrococcus jejuensis]|uniref:Uncharacterized protein n=1 Tax=Agrococcus jejuensis TaxID=399736 RepID=A0A1G8EZV2_9MICO|nr:hypothetical protein [Agrococcus jejuensis]SDH75413.1 hypothetical protein SAMN04489720_2263 [Agrococcus jejuensis]
MSWTRLDDSWTERQDITDLTFEDRWHYLGIIQFCSRTDLVDGVVRAVDARRASDHPNPAAAVERLVAAGLLEEVVRGVRVKQIDQHLPAPHVRRQTEQAKIRKRRERAHRAGDHSLCSPERCEALGAPARDVTQEVTPHVTRDVGTGRDGTGLDEHPPAHAHAREHPGWPTAVPGQREDEEPWSA